MKMAVIQLVVAIILSLLATCGKCVHVLLGDPVTFPETGNCRTDEPAKLHRVGEHSTLSLVAQREQGVWSPVWDYKDRVNRGASFAFNSTVYTDKGLYALGCGSREERTYLHVVIGFEASVYEGEPAKLMCYISGQHVDSIRWEKGQKTLLELNLSSGEIYPPGLDGKLSLSPDGKVGDYSLIFNQVLLEDQGDYFCSAHANGARERWGEPAAVKLRVTRKNPDPTGTRPTRTPTKSVTKEEQMGTWAIVVITAAVVFLIGVPSSILLGWYLKSRRAPHGSGGGRYVCGATVSLLVAPLKPMSALCCQPKSKDNQI